MTTTLEVTAFAGRGWVAGLTTRLGKVLVKLARPSLRHVSVVLAGDARMSTLHGRFRDDPSPTDVLTFEMEHDELGRCTHGEIVICVDEARRASSRVGTRIEDELLLYAVHGVLHLCGYDDRDDQSFRIMHEREDELLRAIGVGSVFAPGHVERAGLRPRMKA